MRPGSLRKSIDHFAVWQQTTMGGMRIKFGEFRKYISKTDRVSICSKETLSYKNYMFIGDVPDSFDDMYLYGIGRIDSEFCADQAPDVAVKQGIDLSSEEGKAEIVYAPCIEITLSDEPREFE